MAFIGLDSGQKASLELELISRDARLKLTRIIRAHCRSREVHITLIRMNQFINIANTVLGKPIYCLESDYMGDYHDADYAWHNGELELIMRRPSTAELVEILADYIETEMLDPDLVNDILAQDKCSFRFENVYDEVAVDIDSTSEIPEEVLASDHPNIRKLVERMDSAVERTDPTAVLHTSASIFETLAKDVLSDAKIEDQSLGVFFDKYRKTSKLPDLILDYILDIFRNRNTTPLAGHGSTRVPTITLDDAVVLAEFTKAIVRAERQMTHLEISRASSRVDTQES